MSGMRFMWGTVIALALGLLGAPWVVNASTADGGVVNAGRWHLPELHQALLGNASGIFLGHENRHDLLHQARARKASRIYPGPYEAEVMTVIDSDTIRVVANAWPGVQVPAAVRVNGVDTPEKFRPKCAHEKELALAATAFVRKLLQPGTWVTLKNVHLGKYAGRVVAEVWLEVDGEMRELGQMLIEAGHAVTYDGGTKQSWCKGENTEE